MAELKAQLGDPRPPGMELSLVRIRAGSAYVGWYCRRDSSRAPYLLSTDPSDYAWETRAQNEARKAAQRAEIAALGL